MIHNYIEEMFEHRQWLHKIVKITKQQLMSMETVRYAELNFKKRLISLKQKPQSDSILFRSLKSEFDFSNLKSLGKISRSSF